MCKLCRNYRNTAEEIKASCYGNYELYIIMMSHGGYTVTVLLEYIQQ